MRKLLIVYMGLAAFASENGGSYGLVIGEKLYKNIFLGVAKLTRYLLNAHIGGKQKVLCKLQPLGGQILLQPCSAVFFEVFSEIIRVVARAACNVADSYAVFDVVAYIFADLYGQCLIRKALLKGKPFKLMVYQQSGGVSGIRRAVGGI